MVERVIQVNNCNKISMHPTGKIIKIEKLVRLIKSAKNAEIIKVEKLV